MERGGTYHRSPQDARRPPREEVKGKKATRPRSRELAGRTSLLSAEVKGKEGTKEKAPGDQEGRRKSKESRHIP